LLALSAFWGNVSAEAPPNPWAKVTAPSSEPTRSVGEYATGCLRGGKPLPLEGDGFVVMHPSRNRVFGHPDLLTFIRTLGKGANVDGLKPVLVGDLSQPRGGPAPGGHSSHQTGLDVDLWFWHPGGRISAAQRESLKSRSILDGKAGTIQKEEAKRVSELLRAPDHQAPAVRRGRQGSRVVEEDSPVVRPRRSLPRAPGLSGR
jgi:penicillin-insensitive murein endopeptidase